MSSFIGMTLVVLYHLGTLGTLITMWAHSQWNWWNWTLLVPLSTFLSEIWPVFWLIQWLKG